jgi:uroporphyrinogen-III synthase
MKVLVVRAIEDARRTATRLSSRGHEAILAPVLEITNLAHDIPAGAFDALIATSAHAFDGAIAKRCVDVPLFVVGERTATAAAQAGVRKPVVVAHNALELADLFRAHFPSRVRALYLAGRDRKPDLERALAGAHDLHVVETYAAESSHALAEEARAALEAQDVGAVLHYSRRSAAIFRSLVESASLAAGVARIRHVAISADAAAPLIEAGWTVDIAHAPDEDAMLSALDKQEMGGPTK